MSDGVAAAEARETASAPAAISAPEIATGGTFGIKGLAWAIFEGARNPYYNLVVIYIFAPYFADVVIGGGERGLTLSGLTITIAGIATALTAPFLGVVADKAGQRKPAIALFLTILGLCSAALWWSQPGDVGLGIWPTMALLATAYCCYGYSEVLHNAMLPQAGRPTALPYISGLGLAMGNVFSVGILIFFLWALMLPASPFAGSGPIPDAPLFGFDTSAYEHQRFAGPFAAMWLAALILPFFLFMPDGHPGAVTWKRAAADLFFGENRAAGERDGPLQRLAKFGRYLVGLFREQPQVMRFLISRTIYADGMAALLTLGAVYVATFMGWNAIEVLIFGLAGLIFGAIGGFVGGALDRSLGPRNALIVELTALVFLLFTQLSITPNSLFFGLVPSGEPVWGSPFFPTLSDLVYFSFIVPVAIAVVACISSSRYMLVHTAPPKRIGEFFGLYAIAGTVTVWMGPGLVSLLTFLSGNQRIGMSGIGIMFAVGLAVLFTVKSDKTPAHVREAEGA